MLEFLTIYTYEDYLTPPQKASKKAGYEKRYLRAPEFPPIEEQSAFDWKTTEPLQLRPFKPKYHLTMGELRAPLNPCFPLFSPFPSFALPRQKRKGLTLVRP